MEGQQEGSRIRKFLRLAEMSKLLKDCQMGLQEALDAFKVSLVLIFVINS